MRALDPSGAPLLTDDELLQREVAARQAAEREAAEAHAEVRLPRALLDSGSARG